MMSNCLKGEWRNKDGDIKNKYGESVGVNMTIESWEVWKEYQKKDTLIFWAMAACWFVIGLVFLIEQIGG